MTFFTFFIKPLRFMALGSKITIDILAKFWYNSSRKGKEKTWQI